MKHISDHALRVIAQAYGQAIMQARKNKAKAKQIDTDIPDYPKHTGYRVTIKGKLIWEK